MKRLLLDHAKGRKRRFVDRNTGHLTQDVASVRPLRTNKKGIKTILVKGTDKVHIQSVFDQLGLPKLKHRPVANGVRVWMHNHGAAREAVARAQSMRLPGITIALDKDWAEF